MSHIFEFAIECHAQFYNKERLESMAVAFRKLNRSHTCLVSKARPILLRWQVYKRRQLYAGETERER